jgi:hypothetical protein
METARRLRRAENAQQWKEARDRLRRAASARQKKAEMGIAEAVEEEEECQAKARKSSQGCNKSCE